jgi:hypothetical protein
MRYRNVIQSKTEALDGKLKNLELIVQRQLPVGEFIKTINEAREILEDIQSFIDREERSPGEVNRI